jgi:FolB domain-containing protein
MRLKIIDLSTSALIGIHDHEKEHPQPLIINVELEYAYDSASKDIFPPDYAMLEKGIKERVENRHHGLLEDLAIEISEFLFSDRRIESATIILHKPRALQWSRAAEIVLRVYRDQDKLRFE